MTTASLITCKKVIVFRKQRLVSRSEGLMKFVSYLWWRKLTSPNSSWVGPEELVRVLDHPTPKHMQRYLDALDSAGIPLVEFRSKTRGAWRLSLPAEQVSVDRSEAELISWFGLSQTSDSQIPSIDTLVAIEQNLRQVLNVDAAFAETGIECEQVESAVTAYRSLLNTPGVTPTLKASLLQRLCMLHRQVSNIVEWKRDIANLEKMVNSGELAGADFEARLRLQQAFLNYDEGRSEEAAYILERINPGAINDSFTLGRYYNALGLASLRHMKKECQASSQLCQEELSACQLTRGLEYFSRAMGYAMAVNDYAGLEGISFNIGNALFRCAKLIDSEKRKKRIQEAARWVGQCEMICHRFGVGGSSHWSRIALIDMVLQLQEDFSTLNSWVSGVYAGFGSIERLLLDTLEDSVRKGNRLEQAECCRLFSSYYERCDDRERAIWYREEAIEIYHELRRPDKIDALLSQ